MNKNTGLAYWMLVCVECQLLGVGVAVDIYFFDLKIVPFDSEFLRKQKSSDK